jgi:Flp pilus assembly pilin Flp
MKNGFRRLCRKIRTCALAEHGTSMMEVAVLTAMLALGMAAGLSHTTKSVKKAYKVLSSDMKADIPKHTKKG